MQQTPGSNIVQAKSNAYARTNQSASLYPQPRGFVQDPGGLDRSVFLPKRLKMRIFTVHGLASSDFNPVRKAMAQSPFFSRPACW
jgi:hypothetical protein